MTVWEMRKAKREKYGQIVASEVYDRRTDRYGWIVGKFKGQKVKFTWSTKSWFYD